MFGRAYLVFKVGIKFYNVRMVQSFVKRYFLSHFFSLVLFDQEWFGNDFSSNDWRVLNCHLSELVTFCESSLKEKEHLVLNMPVQKFYNSRSHFPGFKSKNYIVPSREIDLARIFYEAAWTHLLSLLEFLFGLQYLFLNSFCVYRVQIDWKL